MRTVTSFTVVVSSLLCLALYTLLTLLLGIWMGQRWAALYIGQLTTDSPQHQEHLRRVRQERFLRRMGYSTKSTASHNSMPSLTPMGDGSRSS